MATKKRPTRAVVDDPLATINVKELARRTGLGQARIYELVAQRRIPHLRNGRCIRFVPSAIAMWLAEEARAV